MSRYRFNDFNEPCLNARRPRLDDDDEWREVADEFLYGNKFDVNEELPVPVECGDSLDHLYPEDESLAVSAMYHQFQLIPEVTGAQWDAYTKPVASAEEIEMLKQWGRVGGLVAKMALYETGIAGLRSMAKVSRIFETYVSQDMVAQRK